jgi:hypothetical protein
MTSVALVVCLLSRSNSGVGEASRTLYLRAASVLVDVVAVWNAVARAENSAFRAAAAVRL